MQRRLHRVAAGGDLDREVRAECLVQRIVEGVRRPRPARGGPGVGWRRAHPDGVAPRQRDHLEAIAVVEVARDNGTYGVERRRPLR